MKETESEKNTKDPMRFSEKNTDKKFHERGRTFRRYHANRSKRNIRTFIKEFFCVL